MRPSAIAMARFFRRQEAAVEDVLHCRHTGKPVGFGQELDGLRHAFLLDVAHADLVGFRRHEVSLERIDQPGLFQRRIHQRFRLHHHRDRGIGRSGGLDDRPVERTHQACHCLRLLL
jgi:hypothetical protein